MSKRDSHTSDLFLTGLAPAIWGSTYVVTTTLLAGYSPMTVALLRALPAGLLLLAFTRQLPSGVWWLRIFVLGALNFSVFWSLLFVAAYRLPGGVAATVGSIQPLLVVFLGALLLGTPIRRRAIVAAVLGSVGVATLVLNASASLDPLGIMAGLGSALSMACATVLTRKWQPPVSLLAFTAWQLTAGGLLLLPVAWLAEPDLPHMDAMNLIGLAWLGLVGAALTYALWFRGISRLEPSVVASLGFLSPVTAVLLGWIVLDQQLTPLQMVGVMLVIGSIWHGQRR